MGQDLYERFAAARAVFDRAEAARPGLTAVCFDGPAAELNRTINAQPGLFAVDLACARVLQEAGVEPHGVAGFSLGEIAAAVVVGVMDETQGLALVGHRAAAMQRCSDDHPGLMYAVVKLTADQVDAIAAEVDGVWPVNYNCPGQVSVACVESAGPVLEDIVRKAGGRALPLPVSGAFHSPLMDEAAESLAAYIRGLTFAAGTLPLYANVTGQVYGDPATLLAQQVNHPVRWSQTIEQMIADGFDTFVEVGPGKTLSGFIGKIDAAVRVCSVHDAASLAEAKEWLAHV